MKYFVSLLEKVIIKDIRILQIVLMGSLLSFGAFFYDFSIRVEQIAMTFCSGLITQFVCIKICKLQQRQIFSTIITCFGLSLLLRSDSIWVHPIISCIVISSKFIFRIKDKHIFNPSMLGVIIGITFFPGTWVSPGQWGGETAISIWLLAIGFVVAGRAHLQKISWIFLGAYLALLSYRIIYYGYEWDVFFHQIRNGSLLLFAFFMITDPRTLPDNNTVKIFHTIAVAFIAYHWQFSLYMQVGLVWSLFICSFFIPLWDKLFTGQRFDWNNLSGDITNDGKNAIPIYGTIIFP
jgi:Na+-transporting NADH:ubiquinone oxidoreductase subunit NqrB